MVIVAPAEMVVSKEALEADKGEGGQIQDKMPVAINYLSFSLRIGSQRKNKVFFSLFNNEITESVNRSQPFP